jgi:hypothetical protein
MLELVRRDRCWSKASQGATLAELRSADSRWRAIATFLVTIEVVTSDLRTAILECPNPLALQSFAANYSGGSTPFGEIVAPTLPAYNRPTLVDRSPYRFRVEHGRA